MSYPYLIQGSNIVVFINNETHTVTKSHVTYEKVLNAIRANDWETVKDIIDPKKVVINYGKGNVSIKGETLYWKDKEFHNALSNRMISMIQDGFPVEPMVAFMENLMENPSYRAVNELYEFLEKNNLPITPDGHFLAYKKVNNDYTDVHSKTVPNKLAHMFTEEEKQNMPFDCGLKGEVTVKINTDNVTVIKMPRNQVNDDKNQTCSEGLHFCSKEYLGSFGGDRVMVLKINPRDVVSIPTDYNRSKGRCSRYQIIAELGVSYDEAFDQVVMETPNT
jgi:hypothetical protein